MPCYRRILFAATIGFFWIYAAPGYAIDGPQPGSLNTSTLTLPSGPASIRGLAEDPKVSVFSGELNYGIPIELPEAGGKFAPTMSLNYHGSRGNGPIGLGWNIEFPRIKRSLRLGVPKYDENDELELLGLGNSGRIRPIDDGTYRVEGAGNDVHIKRYGNFFLVTDEDGIRYYMGLNQTGRKASSDGRTTEWLAQLIVHPNGQRVNLAYLTEQSETYLHKIKWGPRNVYTAELSYDMRPDVVTSYRSGFKIVTNLRLSHIVVSSYGETLRTYHLEYDDGFPLSRLAKVRMTGRTEQDEMPEILLTYNTPEEATYSALEGGDGFTPSNPDVAVVDIDADGMADLLRMSPGEHFFYRNLGGHFGPQADLPGAEGTSLSSGRTVLLDMNGDGRTDLVRSAEQWEVYKLNEGGFTNPTEWLGTDYVPVTGNNVVFADINGDGRADMIERVGSGYNLRMNGDGGIAEPEYFESFDGRPLTDELQLRFQDANGDELADAIRVSGQEAEVWPGMGNGRFDFPYVIDFPFDEINLRNIWLADLNRDGVVDVVRVELGDVIYYPGYTDGTLGEPVVLEKPDDMDTNARINIADINGNGSMDILWSTSEAMYYLDFAGAATSGMLTKVENGMGKTMEFSYSASALLALEDELAGDEWFERLPISIPVATRVTTELASGDPSRLVRYHVQDGFYDGEERRFGGFQTGVTTHVGQTPAETRVETQYFHDGLGDQRALRGKAYRTEIKDGNGKLYEITIDQWEALKLPDYPGDPLLRVAANKRTFVLKYEGTSRPTIAHKYFIHDEQGRVTQTKDYGRADIGGDEVFTTEIYADNDSTWVRNRVVEKKVEDGDGKIVDWQKTYYDDKLSPIEFGQITKGWPRRVEALLKSNDTLNDSDETEDFITVLEKDYDSLGNPVRIVEKGVERQIEYDDDGIYPVSELKRPNEEVVLVWTMEWDRVIGKPVALSDPNGVKQGWTYDGLGRLKTTSVNDVTYQIHNYFWASPTPKQTTLIFDGDINQDGVVNSNDTRVIISVANSAGEPLFKATALESGRWLLNEGKRYDMRGNVSFLADALDFSGYKMPLQLPAESVGQEIKYDALGRTILQTLPTGSQKTTVYSPFAKEVVTDSLAPVTYEFDGQEQIIKTSRTINEVEEVTTARYDAGGRMLEISLQNGQVIHQYGYDTLGRLLSAADGDVGMRTYEYDDGGRLLRFENGVGQEINYSYDLTGRLTHIDGDVQSPVVIHYDYAEIEDDTVSNTLGRPVSIQEGTDRIDYAYNDLGKPAMIRRQIAGETMEQNITWTPSGLMLQKSFDDGLTLDHSYDRAGRIVKLGDLWAAQELDAGGRVLDETYGNNIQQSYVRNALGLPDRIQILSGQSHLVDLVNTFNTFGALAHVQDNDGNGLNHSASYSYDAAARLTKAELPDMVFDYGYDQLQNMVERDVTFLGPIVKESLADSLQDMLKGAYHYGEDNHGKRQMTSAGDKSFAYDSAGRMIQDGEAELHYDAQNRMIRYQHPVAGIISYRYGLDGQRTLTQAENGEMEIAFEENVTYKNGVRTHYVKLEERVIARVDIQLTEDGWQEQKRVYHHRGPGFDSILLTDESGNVIDERRHEPFGVDLDANYAVDVYGPGGKPVDTNTGFVDHGVRWYAPEHGHWMVPDPPAMMPQARYMQRPWDLNPYQFVNQNPMLYHDPDGRDGTEGADRKRDSYKETTYRAGNLTFRYRYDQMQGVEVLTVEGKVGKDGVSAGVVVYQVERKTCNTVGCVGVKHTGPRANVQADRNGVGAEVSAGEISATGRAGAVEAEVGVGLTVGAGAKYKNGKLTVKGGFILKGKITVDTKEVKQSFREFGGYVMEKVRGRPINGALRSALWQMERMKEKARKKKRN